ncbi:MAG: aminoacyl-tRNA hydrolase [Gemmatimonadaceae bacterium]
MKVILGLGNPGREYEATRHNVGWWVLDHLADVWRFERWRATGDAAVTSGSVGGTKARLVKPLTYMNLSGQALRPYLRRPFWSPATDLLVIVDDVALPLGTMRLRARGSAGGHNGLKSVEHQLKSQDYPRLRIGIGPVGDHRGTGDLADFVLGAAGNHERREIEALLPAVASLAERWVAAGVEAAMNEYKTRPPAPGKPTF